jgi:hypothetical protein
VILLAYLDPISGSFLFQALAALALAGLVYARAGMRQIRALLGIAETKDEDDEDEA